MLDIHFVSRARSIMPRTGTLLDTYSWPLNNTGVKGTNPHAVDNPPITSESPKI